MKIISNRNLIFLLLILHSVGIIGILTPQLRDLILSLSFVNLLIAFIVLFISLRSTKSSFLVFMSLAFIIGFTAELIGVHTGLLFGNYNYGANLGLKFLEVPLIIGVNWGVLAVTSASLTEKITGKLSVKVMLNSFLMVFFDFIMEPVAMKSDFWSWENNEIPLYNYICWFVVSLIIQFILLFFFKFESNKVFKSLFIIQLFFFLILNLS